MSVQVKYRFDPSISPDVFPRFSVNGAYVHHDEINTDGTITRTLEFSDYPSSVIFGNNGAPSRAIIEILEYPMNSKMTSFYNLFCACNNLIRVDTANWDTSNITDFDYCFSNCTSLETIDISGWDISKSNYRSQMLANCTSLKTLILDGTTGWNKLSTNDKVFYNNPNLATILMRNSAATQINYVINKGLVASTIGSELIVTGVDDFSSLNVSAAEGKNWSVYTGYSFTKYRFTTGVDTLPAVNSDCTYTIQDTTNSDGTTTRVLLLDNQNYPTSLSFANCTGLVELVNVKSSNLTTLKNMFNGCTSLQSVSMPSVDLTNITDTSYMFNNCSTLTDINMVKTWTNRQNLTNMSYMFAGCSSITSAKFFDGWDLTNTTTTGIFNSCSSLDTILATNSNVASVNKLITSLPTRTSANPGQILIAPLTTADVNATTAQSRYWNIDDNIKVVTKYIVHGSSDNYNLPNITTDEELLYIYETNDEGNKVVTIGYLLNLPTYISFYNCSEVIEICEINKDIVNNMTSHYQMFYMCTALKNINMEGWTLEKSINMASMFVRCESLEYLDVSNFNTSKATNMSSMFDSCATLENIIGLENFKTGQATYIPSFSNCFNLKSLDGISNWDVRKCTSISAMFNNCRSLKHLDLSNWRFEYTGEFNARGVFMNCYNLESVGDLSNWGIKRNEHPASMFQNCRSLKHLNVANWDITHADHHSGIHSIFKGCYSLETLDITNWQLFSPYVNSTTGEPSGSDPSDFFADCYSLREIIGLETVDFREVKGGDRLFYGTDSMDVWNLSNHNFGYLTAESSRLFGDSQNLKYINLSNTKLPVIPEELAGGIYGCPRFRFLNLDDSVNDPNFMVSPTAFDKASELAVIKANNAYDSYIDHIISALPARPKDDPGFIIAPNITILTSRVDKTESYKLVRYKDGVLETTEIGSPGLLVSFDSSSEVFKVDTFFNNIDIPDLPIKSATVHLELFGSYVCPNYYDGNGKNVTNRTAYMTSYQTLQLDIDVTDSVETLLDPTEEQHGYFIMTGSSSSAYVYFRELTLEIEYDRSHITEPIFNAELAAAKCWNVETRNVIAEYTFDSSTTTFPTFNYGFSGYTTEGVDNGDGTTTLTISHPNTLPTSISFRNCEGLISVQRLDLEKVSDASSMFEGCVNLKSIGRHFGIFRPTEVKSMFKDCANLSTIDISTWLLTDLLDTSNMFSGCTSLKKLNIDNLGNRSVLPIKADGMFANCNKLIEVSLEDSSVPMVEAVVQELPTKTMRKPGHISIRGVKSDDVANIENAELKYWNVEDRTLIAIYTFDSSIEREEDVLPIFHPVQYYGDSIGMPNIFYYDNDDGNGIITRTVYHPHNLPLIVTFNNYPSLLKVLELNTDDLTTMNGVFTNCSNLKTIKMSELYIDEDTDVTEVFDNVDGNTPVHEIKIAKTDAVTFNKLISELPPRSEDEMGIIYTNEIDDPSLIDKATAESLSWKAGLSTLEYLFFTTMSTLPQITVNTHEYFDITENENNTTRIILTDSYPTIINFNNNAPGLLEVYHVCTKQMTDMHEMFNGCSNLTKIHGIEDWDVSKVAIMNNMFRGTKISNLDLSKWDVRNVTDMKLMFYNMPSLETLNISNWKTEKLNSMTNMFGLCSSLVDIQGINELNTSNVTSLESVFDNCTKLQYLDISKWNTGKVNSLKKLFHNCLGLESLDISNWNTGKVTTMDSMFAYCEKLRELSLLDWDTSNVTDMQLMFYYCKELPNQNLLNWNTSKVTNMSYMFENCLGMTSIDISNWNTGNVTNMERMMYECRNLKTVNLSGIKLGMISNMNNMLTGVNCYDIGTIILYDSNFSAINKVIAQLSNWNATDHPKKIYISRKADISKIDVATAESKYWQIVQGDIVKALNKDSLAIKSSNGRFMKLNVKRLHIGDTTINKY